VNRARKTVLHFEVISSYYLHAKLIYFQKFTGSGCSFGVADHLWIILKFSRVISKWTKLSSKLGWREFLKSSLLNCHLLTCIFSKIWRKKNCNINFHLKHRVLSLFYCVDIPLGHCSILYRSPCEKMKTWDLLGIVCLAQLWRGKGSLTGNHFKFIVLKAG
jgi:hypothetical protein